MVESLADPNITNEVVLWAILIVSIFGVAPALGVIMVLNDVKKSRAFGRKLDGK